MRIPLSTWTLPPLEVTNAQHHGNDLMYVCSAERLKSRRLFVPNCHLTNPEKSLTPKPYASHIGKNCLCGLTPARFLLAPQVLTRASLDMTNYLGLERGSLARVLDVRVW